MLFEIYVLPIFYYGAPLYLEKCSDSAMRSLDAVQTKFLKRYMSVKPWSNNAITYHLTGTMPLSRYLRARAQHLTRGFVFPDCMSGLQLSFLHEPTATGNDFDPIPDIPTTFWCSRTFSALPTNPFYRKKLCHEIFDKQHSEICKTDSFHKWYEPSCYCKFCNEHAHPYHGRYCTGAPVSPC